MKKIKHVSFSGRILIPDKLKFEKISSPFLSAPFGRLSSSDDDSSTILDVMIFNCENIADIPSIVESEIKTIEDSHKDNPERKTGCKAAEFFSALKKEIEDESLRHELPEELINFLNSDFPGLKKEGVIYINGVSSLVEV